MNVNKRIEELEKAVEPEGDAISINGIHIHGSDVTIHLTWGDDDEVEKCYEVAGVRMTETEFYRRYPDFVFGDDSTVSVNWK